jgi:hypothetical protein
VAVLVMLANGKQRHQTVLNKSHHQKTETEMLIEIA